MTVGKRRCVTKIFSFFTLYFIQRKEDDRMTLFGYNEEVRINS